MEVPTESFHRSSWDSRTCYPRRAFNQGLTDNNFLVLLRAALGSPGTSSSLMTASLIRTDRNALINRNYQRMLLWSFYLWNQRSEDELVIRF